MTQKPSKKTELAVVTLDQVERRIYEIRGNKVMLDSELAALYGVTTGRMNEQVRRNLERFPDDFMFQLNDVEFKNLISQFATSSFEVTNCDLKEEGTPCRGKPRLFGSTRSSWNG